MAEKGDNDGPSERKEKVDVSTMKKKFARTISQEDATQSQASPGASRATRGRQGEPMSVSSHSSSGSLRRSATTNITTARKSSHSPQAAMRRTATTNPRDRMGVNATALKMQERAAKDAKIRQAATAKRSKAIGGSSDHSSSARHRSRSKSPLRSHTSPDTIGGMVGSAAGATAASSGTAEATTSSHRGASAGTATSSTTASSHRGASAASTTSSTSTTSGPRLSTIGREFDNDVLSDLPEGPMTTTHSNERESMTLPGGTGTNRPFFSYIRRQTSEDASRSSAGSGSLQNVANFNFLSLGSRGSGTRLSDASSQGDGTTPNLGSTLLADRNEKFKHQQYVDQSVNLMDPDFATLGSDDQSNTNRSRRARFANDKKSQTSVMDLVFGGGHNARVRKKSMVEVILGPDPRTFKQRQSSFRDDEDSTCDRILSFLVSNASCIIILLLLITATLITALILIDRVPAMSSPTAPNVVLAIPSTPEPTLGSSPNPTQATEPTHAPVITPQPSPATSTVTATSGAAATRSSTNVEETSQQTQHTANVNVKSAIKFVHKKGVPHDASKSAATAHTAAKKHNDGLRPKVFSLPIKQKSTPAPTATQLPSDPKSHLESIIVQKYGLTDPTDLVDPHSSAARALEWVLQTWQGEPIEVDADEGDGMDEQKNVERYIAAVFYYATQHEENSNHSSSRRHLNHGNSHGKTHGTKGAEEGTNWIESSSDESICQWKGIRCNKRGIVTHLKLPRAGLRGTLPSELQGLKNLYELDVGHNELHGTIPDEIGNLSTLTYFAAPDNTLTGTLPPLDNLVHLHEINLANNNLEGPIPSSFNGFQDLLYVVLSGNRFEKTIPTFTNCGKLKKLELQGNKMTGMIPLEALSKLEKLEELRLGHNLLTGTLSSTGIKKFASLAVLSLPSNHLGGTFPDVFDSHWLGFHELDITGNAFRGPLPATLGVHTEIKHLNLGENLWTGSIPALWFGLTNLQSLVVNNSTLSGSIPAILAELKHLRNLFLNHNTLTGPIPSELGTLKKLKHLHLEDNRLTGEIPPSFASLVGSLESLLLFRNNLEGNTSSLCSEDVSNLQEFATDCLTEVVCDCCLTCY
ncbi:STYKc [Seminavis robusta]|uniref:STYKc n=1 Tax=Seminavis robusta TaxID=568900 RepID=A0A9N8D8Y2_9STRA|nr:STYKc [Seminavis robusta]|eukprot:Sro41_g025320.1 STYKc (1092) ;mRNA; f:120040-124070